MTGFLITQNGTLLSRTGAKWGWERYILDVGWVRWATGKYATHDWNLVLHELQELGKDTLPVKLVTKKMLANFAQSEQTQPFTLATLAQFNEPKEWAPYATRNGDILWKEDNNYWERYSFDDSGDYEHNEFGSWDFMMRSHAGDDLPVKKLSKQLFATPC